jgi:hypothetical protein
MNINLSNYQIHYIYIKEVNVANHFEQRIYYLQAELQQNIV